MNELKLRPHTPRDVAKLVEEQVLSWSLREKPSRGSRPYWPVVTISREYGSQGAELGKRVAHRLGFAYWDREIVTNLAETLRAGEVAVSQLDEHVRTAIDDLLGTVLFQQPIMGMDYCDQLRNLLIAIQKRGGAVIIGRGAHCFLDADCSLRVRVVCPLSRRVAGLRARKGLSQGAAIHEIRTADAERAEFVRKTFGADITDSSNYDITINSDSLGPEKADALVLMAYGVKFGRLPTATGDVHEGRVDLTPEG